MRRLLIVPALALALAVPAAGQVVDEQARRQAIQHYREGQTLLYQEHFDKAAIEFEKAIDLDPLLTLAHYGLGQAKMGLKEYASAVIAFTNCREAARKIHQLADSDQRAAQRLRDDELRELRDSLQYIQSGVIKSVDPVTISRIQDRIRTLEQDRRRMAGTPFVPPPEVSLALGSAYFRKGDLADAEREYRAAIDAKPKFGEAHNNLAVVLMLTNRLDEAEQHVKQAEKAGFRVHPQFKDDLKAKKKAGS